MNRVHSLQQLQEQMQAHLLGESNAITNQVVVTETIKSDERLGIYRDAYRYRLLEVLEKDYNLLQRYLGAAAFNQLGFAYIAAYPSRYFSVNHVGQHMAEFLKRVELYKEQPYLSELAAFIWALNTAVDAPDAPVITAAEIAQLAPESWPDMYLTLHPTVQLLTFTWNIVPLWQALLDNKPLPALEQQINPNYCLVWRKALQSYYCPITKEAALVIKALQEGQSFGEICNNLLEHIPEAEVASYVVTNLSQWLHDEMFAKVEVRS